MSEEERGASESDRAPYDARQAELDDLRAIDDEAPPILGSWRRLYALVLAVLVVIIVLLGALTRAFAT